MSQSAHTYCPHCGQTMPSPSIREALEKLELLARAEAICEERGAPVHVVLSKDHRRLPRYITFARTYVWKMLHERGLSYPDIGEIWDRDHTSIMRAVHWLEESGGDISIPIKYARARRRERAELARAFAKNATG